MTGRHAKTAVVRQVLPASPDEVYAEWIDPVALAEFICPSPTTAGRIDCDPRVGGKLSIEMVDPDRIVHVTGEYLELDRPHKLRFTWSADLGDGFDSVVTVTLEPHGEAQTLMTIEHAQLPPEWSEDHQRGWTRIAEQLERRLRTHDATGS